MQFNFILPITLECAERGQPFKLPHKTPVHICRPSQTFYIHSYLIICNMIWNIWRNAQVVCGVTLYAYL
jgi:hypothetical protein